MFKEKKIIFNLIFIFKKMSPNRKIVSYKKAIKISVLYLLVVVGYPAAV